jgi:hypothetical protein
MTEQIRSQVISRRKMLFLVGLAASLAAPVAVLTASDARAQQPAEQATPGEQAAPKKKVKKKKKKKEKATPSGTAPSGTAPQTTQPKAQ